MIAYFFYLSWAWNINFELNRMNWTFDTCDARSRFQESQIFDNLKFRIWLQFNEIFDEILLALSEKIFQQFYVA